MNKIIGTSPLLTASLSHFIAERDKALAELDIYLNRPVGVGEHAKVTDEVFALFKKLDEAQSVMELVKGIMADDEKQKVAALLTELDKAKKGINKKNKNNGHSA